MDNWKRLAREEGVEQGGPAINIYQELKTRNKLGLIKYAAGLPGLHFDRSSQVYSDSYALHKALLCVSWF
jgi:hypothetical protein